MSQRKRLATIGEHGGSPVRLFLDERRGVKRYVVQWGTRLARQQESWPPTRQGRAAAEAFFKAFAEEAHRKDEPESVTMHRLWALYTEAEFPELRPRTRAIYADAWRFWENFAGGKSFAESVSVEQMVRFRRQLEALDLATMTVKKTIDVVRIVYRWAEAHELITRNRWHLYRHKIAKEKRTQPRAEFRSDEFLAIWRQFDPAKAHQWRGFVLTGLLGIYGNRQTELLAGLQWESGQPGNLSRITDDEAVIDRRYVKTCVDIRLPLFPLSRELLAVAKAWAAREGYCGAHVFYPGLQVGSRNVSKLAHYSIQSYTNALHAAERRAGITPIPFRAGHGFRRGLVGDLTELTGDVHGALQAINDRDPRMATHYRVRRDDSIQKLLERRIGSFDSLPDSLKCATNVQPNPENDETAGVGGFVSTSR